MRLPIIKGRQSEGGLPARPASLPGTLTRWVIPFAAGTLLLFTGTGCGSGGGTPDPTPSPTATATPATPFTGRFVIDWPARSRSITGLSSALSARFTLFSANPDGSDLSFTVNRPASLAATSQSYPTPSPIRREWGGILSVDFYSEANGGGIKVGTAGGTSFLPGTAQDGTVPTFSNGPETAVSTVTILPASLPLGATTQLLFSARQSDGTILALTPGSAIFRLADPADSSLVTLTPDGLATPIGSAPAPSVLGSVNVIATVDGKASPALSVPVVSNGSITITPTTGTAPVVSLELPLQFAATVTGLPPGAPTTVSYRVGNANGTPDTSGTSGSITGTGLYTAPRQGGTFTVTAFSTYDPSKTATTVVQVRSLVAVTITPTNANDPGALDVVINNTVPLAASVSSIPAGRDSGVTWSVVDAAGEPVLDSSAGTVTNTGVYTAPATRGTYYVKAVSRYDTSKMSVLRINALAGTLPVNVN